VCKFTNSAHERLSVASVCTVCSCDNMLCVMSYPYFIGSTFGLYTAVLAQSSLLCVRRRDTQIAMVHKLQGRHGVEKPQCSLNLGHPLYLVLVVPAASAAAAARPVPPPRRSRSPSSPSPVPPIRDAVTVSSKVSVVVFFSCLVTKEGSHHFFMGTFSFSMRISSSSGDELCA
jgi:hypothetical protein